MKRQTPLATAERGLPLVTGAALLFSVAFSAQADFVRSSVSLGGYFIDAQDAPHDGNLYQNERIQVNALKNGVGLNVAYGYSDLYDKRPNTYANANRLAQANVTYAPPPIPGLSLKVGREYEPLLERPLFYDGGSAKLAYHGKVQAELFGGYGVPTVYEEDLATFDEEKGIIGGKLTYSPMQSLVLYADGVVNGKQDDGSLGLEVQVTATNRISLSANSVYRLDSSAVSHGEVSGLVRVRERDELQLRFMVDDEKIDSSRYYEYFVDRSHKTLSGGYVLNVGDGVNLSADYGLVFYGGALGQMASFKVFNNGVYFKVEKDWRTTLEAFNLNLGYGGIFENRWLLNVGAGYSHYDLSDRKTDQTAIDFTFSPGIQFKQGLQLNVGYEYLSNRMYTNDNRFFASFKHSFFKGLTQ